MKVRFPRSAVGCLLFLAARALTGSDGRIYKSRMAGLLFEVPGHVEVHEVEVSVDRSLTMLESIRIIRILPAGVREEASLGRSLVTITIRRMNAALSAAEWLSGETCGDAPGSTTERIQVRIAGQSAIRTHRTSNGRPTEPPQFFVARSGWIYQFYSGSEKDDSTLGRVLRTLRFMEPGEDANAPEAQPLESRSVTVMPQVRAVYLVPSDRIPQEGYRIGIERAIRQLQVFYRDQLANGKAFSLPDPVVEVLPTSHPVSWYRTDAPASSEAGRFWESVLNDGFQLTGGAFDDPNNLWVFYIDADPLCSQYVGGTHGIALLPRNDLRGLVCDGNTPPCPDQNPDLLPICRWVGGLGHEVGHAFNLPHPNPGTCPAPDTSCAQALMWTGYAGYPNAYLLPSDKSTLLNSPLTAQFFAILDPGPLPDLCTAGCPPERPTGLLATGQPGQIALTWNPSTGATSYVVWRSGSSTGPFSVVSSSISATSLQDNTVVAGNSYWYFVTAQNSGGQSGNSNVAVVTTSVVMPVRLYTVSPCRVADTREPIGQYGGPALSASTDRTFTIAGRCNIPSSAKAISLNATVTQPTAPGHLTLHPGGTFLPLASVINYRTGQTRANNAIVPLGANGTLAVFCGQGTGTTHLIIDVNGHFE